MSEKQNLINLCKYIKAELKPVMKNNCDEFCKSGGCGTDECYLATDDDRGCLIFALQRANEYLLKTLQKRRK